MTQNIEQRTELAVKKYEGASEAVDKLAHTDSDVETSAGPRKSFPKISREWNAESQRLQVDWNDESYRLKTKWQNESSVIREDWNNERSELSTKALGVKSWESGQEEANINQQRRWIDNHTYLPKTVPALMGADGPDENWIPYTADKSDTLTDVFGRKPVTLIDGVTLTPNTHRQYPVLFAFGKMWDLDDGDIEYVVKSFRDVGGDVLEITLDDDSILQADRSYSASRQWAKYENHGVLEKTTVLKIFPRVGDLLVNHVIPAGVDGVQIKGAIYSIDGVATGSVEDINTTKSTITVSGKEYRIFARDLQVSSVDQLRLTRAVNNQSAFVKSYHSGWAAQSDSPSGGGWFKFTNETGLADNGGTVIQGVGGFWIRGYKESYTPEDFGAIGVKSVTLDENNVPKQTLEDSSDALNSLFASVDSVELPSNYGFAKPLVIPKVGVKIKGKGLYKNGLYQIAAWAGALIQTDPAITRMWDHEISDFFISAIGGTKVTGYRLNNPNGRCNIKRIRWTRTTFLRVDGTALQIKRNTGEQPELIDGYFSITEDCFVQQWAYGYNYDGTDQYVNAHWNNRCTATDGGVGWWCLKSNSIRITHPHGELLDTAILNQESNDLDVSGGYFERNKFAAIRNQNSNACRYHNNLFASSGFGQTDPGSGAGVVIESGHQNSVKDNFFNEKFIDAHVRVGSGAINTIIVDNSVKRRTIHGGWESDKLTLVDDGINTIFKGVVKDADGSFHYEMRNIRLNEAVLTNSIIETVHGSVDGSTEHPVITCGINVTPWDANADLPKGSLFIKTGSFVKLYQRKTNTGDLSSDWVQFQIV